MIEHLATALEPGLTAMPSGRFYGMVIGGTHPAALAADWLVSAWDQNAGLARLTPAATATEQVAERAGCSTCSGLPAGSAVGFVTGGTMANFTCLAAGRDAVLRRAGWDVATARAGRAAPACGCWSGEERHDTVDLALRYLGLGAPEPVRADDQGRLDAAALDAALRAGYDGPTVVCLQAGNVHSGGYDPFAEAIEVAHRHGAWVHVDGAFGLFAAAAPAYRHLTDGRRGRRLVGHRRPQDPQRALRLRHRDRPRPGRGQGGDGDARRLPDPRRGRRPVREGARALPAGQVGPGLRGAGRARPPGRGRPGRADGRPRGGVRRAGSRRSRAPRCSTTWSSPRSASASASDERTREVVARLLADGEAWMSGSLWRGRAVLRISVSNWSTTEGDVRRSLRALARGAAGAPNRADAAPSVD